MKTIRFGYKDYTCVLSERFRRHTPEERARMTESIKANGIHLPVKVYRDTDLDCDNCILDGEGRLEIAVEVGADVAFDDVGELTTAKAFELAKDFNDHRRQDDPESIRKRRQERVERVAAKRAEGKSLRTIAAEEGVSHVRVKEDLEEAGVKGLTPEPEDKKPAKVKGRDGKEYKASKPKKQQPASEQEAEAAEVPASNGRPTKPAAECDGWGIPIQPHAEAAFADRPKFDEIIRLLRQADQLYSKLAELPGGIRLTIGGVSRNTRHKWKHIGIENAIRALEDARPTYTVCPYAYNPHQDHPEKCPLCHDLNWIPEVSKDRVSAELINNAKEAFGVHV